MAYEMLSNLGSGALSGAGSGALIGKGNPYITAGGALIGAIGGALQGSESSRRNKLAEEYARREMLNARQQTLMALAERKKKWQWQNAFNDALRTGLMKGV